MNKTLESLIKKAIPVSKAKFHSAVDNGYQVPENQFDERSENKNRKVEMWWYQDALICHQNDKYWVVPMATVAFANLKSEDIAV